MIVGTVRDKHGSERVGDIVRVHASLLARVLYSNPVCLLTTERNLMTISWLTATDNHVRLNLIQV